MSIVKSMIPSEEIFVPTRSRLGDIELRAAFEAFIRADEFIPEWAVQVILNHPEESPDMLVQVVNTCGDTLCTSEDCLSQGHINGLYLLAVMQAAEAYGSVVSALLLYENFYDEFFQLDRPAILARLVDSPDHWLDCVFGSSNSERAALIVEATPHLVYSGILERQMASDNLLQAAQSQKLSINCERMLPVLVDAISALAVPSALEPLTALLSQSTLQLPAPQADFAERFKDPEETFRKTMEHCRQLEITDFFECMQRKATREHFSSVANNLHDALQILHRPVLTNAEAFDAFRCFTRFPEESTPPLLEFFRTALSEDLAGTSKAQLEKAAIVEQVLIQLVVNGSKEVLPLVIDALHGWMGALTADHPLCMHLIIPHVAGRLADSPEQIIDWAFQLVHRTEVADGLLEAVPIMVYEELATREHCVAALRARLHEAYETNSETLTGIASALIALGDTGENGEVFQFAFERRLQLSDWIVKGTSPSAALADIPEAVANSARRYFFEERIDSVAARLKAAIYTDPMTFDFDEIEDGQFKWNFGNKPEHLNFDPAEYAVALDRHVAEVANEFTLLEGTADEVARYIRNVTLQALNGMSDAERRRWRQNVLGSNQPGLSPGMVRSAFRSAEHENSQGPMTIRNSGPKVGRNDPCPCGSGRKYKKCCGQG